MMNSFEGLDAYVAIMPVRDMNGANSGYKASCYTESLVDGDVHREYIVKESWLTTSYGRYPSNAINYMRSRAFIDCGVHFSRKRAKCVTGTCDRMDGVEVYYLGEVL